MTAGLSRSRGFLLPAPAAQDSGQPAGSRPWLRSPAAQGGLALAIYLLAWLSTGGRELLLHLGRARLDQVSMDPNFYVWCLRWWPYAVVHGLNPLYTHQLGAPAGYSLAWVTTVPPLALLAAPVTLITGPVATFNLLSVIAIPLSAWAAFLLCRRLTGKFWAAVVGGAVFGFSAYEMNHSAAGQLNLTFSLLVPILAYLVVIWWQGSISNRAFVILAALAMATQFYLFLETFADMTGILVVSVLLGLVLAGRDARPVVLRAARYIGLAFVAAIVLALPYLVYALSTKPGKLSSITGLDVLSLVVPRQTRTLGIGWLAHLAHGPAESSGAGYIGVPLLLLVILLAVGSWSSRLVRFLTCMLVFIIVAAFGPYLYFEGGVVGRLPWGRLWELPILRNAYPSRLMLFAFLILAVATALWLAGPARRQWSRWPLALVVLAFIAMDVPTFDVRSTSTVPAFITSGQYRHVLRPGEIVVVVSEVGNAGMLWQAETGFYVRLGGGFINQAITPHSDLPRLVQALDRPTPAAILQFESYVRTSGIGAILVDAAHETPLAGIFWRLGLVGQRLGRVVVYPTDGCRSCRTLNWRQLRSGPLAVGTR